MEAKDTAMNDEVIVARWGTHPTTGDVGVYRSIAQIQAEISYKAGVEQGRREEQERVATYLIERYGGVGRNASRRAAYNVAKALALDLTFRSVGINLGGRLR